jgi:hypothetical protein
VTAVKKNYIVLTLALLLLGGTFCGLYWWDQRADGFTVEKISSDLPYNPAWESKATPNANVGAILSQPFYYLGRGFQCYAFVSKDGKYVLKFLRHQRLRNSQALEAMPNLFFIEEYRAKGRKKRADRLAALFTSLKIAYEKIPEQAGIIYLHLNKTNKKLPQVTIYDKCENKYQIALDKFEFIIQKRAALVKPTITQCMSEGKLEDAKKRIDQVFTLLRKCAAKGVCDIDRALIKKDNVGFTEDRAIYIDVGTFVLKEAKECERLLAQDFKRLRPLYKWLAVKYPELAAYMEEKMNI